MENFPLLSRLSAMENIDLSSLRKRLNADLSSAKRYLRWKWLRLSRRRFLARNVEGAPPGLKADFLSMLEDEEGADVTLVVGDRQFRAYRRVLAAGSRALEAELLGQMQEQETSAELVKIDDMEPSIFEALLHYACTGALPDNVDSSERLQGLLAAADRYGMHNLMAMCEWRLCRSIDAQTVPTTLALAEKHHRAKLKDACIRFESTKSVLATIKEQELPSRVKAGIMALLGTRVQGRLALLGTKATSLFRHARDSQACRDVGLVLVFLPAAGLFFYVSIKMGHIIEEALQREQDSWLENLQEIQSCISRVSWVCRLTFLERNLQDFQESAWLNSDI